jgi:cardiolipin synthase
VPLVVYRPFKIPFRLRWGLVFRLIKFFKVINRRNHRKIVLIDERIVFIGSFNITQVHSQRYMGPRAWRDTAVKIDLNENPDLDHEFKMLRSTIYRTIRKALPSKLKAELPKIPLVSYNPQKSRFRLNSKLKWRSYLYKDLKKRIHLAKKRILITNAYFVPKLSLIRVLCRAARRGVFVGIILPKSSDVWLVRVASRRLYGILLNGGVQLYQYTKSNLHAKTMIIDDWATVGSHNLNHRSFIHDLEIEVSLTEPNNVQKMLLQWDLDLKDCEPLTLKNFKDSYIQTFLSYVLYTFMRYWL